MTTVKQPETLQEAITYFSDPERVFVYAVNLRWPDKHVTCPRCGGDKHSFIKTRRIWFCKGCKKQFTVKVGTIFEDSALGLDKWMTAVWMVVNCKNGISSYELHRAIGVTQKSAWFMLQRIREVLKPINDGTKFGSGPGSECEVDETYIGGKSINMHRARRIKALAKGHNGKTIVQGFFDRDIRKVRAHIVPNIKRETLQNAVMKNIKFGSSVYTDEAVAYDKLHSRFVHEMVNHSVEYVRGRVHTNSLENFWSLLKRSLKGTYVAVEPFHLSRYIDEQVFRYNFRSTKEEKMTDNDRFEIAMQQIAGKRLTYAELTGKTEEEPF
jgi:transposase-like protein